MSRVENFKSILNFNSLTQLEYSGWTSWFNLNTWIKNSDSNQVLMSHEFDSISKNRFNAISLTFISRAALENQLLELTDESTSEEFTTKLCMFWKDVNAMTHKMKLLQNQLSQIEVTENACKACKKQSDKIFKIEDILYIKDARSMIQDRQKLKNERQKKREVIWKKRYLNALKKCYRATKSHRTARIKFVQTYQKKWRVILKELVKYHHVYNE